MKPIEIPYSERRFDQWRLSKSGGQIVVDKHGVPRFRFRNREQFEEYKRLNGQREVVK